MPVNAQTIGHMSAQWGLITRQQAICSGMSRDEIDRLARSRRWTAVRRGVYAESAYVALLTSHAQRRLLADRAASLRVSAPHVLSHHSAAYLLDLGVLHEARPFTHLTRPGVVGSHLRHGVKHHLAPYRAEDVTTAQGVSLLGPARTALDIAREQGYRSGLVAADSALREGATRADLESALGVMTFWPYSTVARAVTHSASASSDSVAETLGRDLVSELGFGVPQQQFGLTAGGRTAWCDLRLGRHFFEVDGKAKLIPVGEGGLASRSPADVLWDEKLRQDFVTGFKTGVSRLTWADFFGSARTRAIERCRREYLDTCARFGTDVSDLTQYRPRGRRPRPTARHAPLMPVWVP